MAKRDEPRSGEGRLTRWSRLKREAVAEKTKKKAEPRPAPPEAKTAALTPADPFVGPPTGGTATPLKAGQTEEQKKIDAVTKDLPPLESLGRDSDYTLFMREGVPEEMRTAALRKLWRSDPAFTEQFPFEMHMEDYNKTFTPINAATDTIFRAGLGYLFDDDDKTKAEKPTGKEIVDKSAPGRTEMAGEITSESVQTPPAARKEIDQANLAEAPVRMETPEGEKSLPRKPRAG